jgi:hypothetical protein
MDAVAASGREAFFPAVELAEADLKSVGVEFQSTLSPYVLFD